MKNIEHIEIRVADIILLERNPRLITNDSFKKLCSDIQKDPNFLIQRPPLVNSLDGRYYCYAGTQRVKACIELKYEKVKCFVEVDVPEKVQNERMLKDNLHRGIWDEDKFMDLGFEVEELEGIGITGFNGLFEGLEDNNFSNTTSKLTDEFSVTFVFNKKHEETLKGFIAAHGKDPLIEVILNKANKEEI